MGKTIVKSINDFNGQNNYSCSKRKIYHLVKQFTIVGITIVSDKIMINVAINYYTYTLGKIMINVTTDYYREVE